VTERDERVGSRFDESGGAANVGERAIVRRPRNIAE
jgi:hypothetical protein